MKGFKFVLCSVLLVPVLIFLITPRLTAQEPINEDLERYEQAGDMYEQGRHEEALAIFRDLDEVDLGFWRNFRVDRAIERLETEIEGMKTPVPDEEEPVKDTDVSMARYRKGVGLYEEGRYSEAKIVFYQLLDENLGFEMNTSVREYMAAIDRHVVKYAPPVNRPFLRRVASLTPQQQKAVDILQKEGRIAKIASERRDFLSEHHVDVGMEFYKKFDFEKARAEFGKALTLNPRSKEALMYLEKCNTMLNIRKDKIPEFARREFEVRQAEVERARLEMERFYEEGKRLMAEKEFDEAIVKFQAVREIVHWMPYKEDVSSYERGTKELIAQAERGKKKHKVEMDRIKSEEAARALEEEIKAEDEYERQKIERLMGQAMEFRRLNKFERAIELYDEILILDPNKFRATIAKIDSQTDLLKKKREDFAELRELKTEESFLNSDELSIPQIGVIKKPYNWDIVRKRVMPQLGERREIPEWRPPMEEMLDTKKVSVFFTETPLSQILVFLGDLTDIDFVADLKGEDDFEEDVDPFITIRVNNMTLRSTLNWIATLSGTKWGLKDQAVYFSMGAIEQAVLRFYPIRDLMYEPTDFPGRRFELSAGGEEGGIDWVDESEDATGFEPDMLIEFIQNINAESWEEGENKIEYHGGMLLVINTPDVHGKIAELLGHFRSTRGLQVAIDAQFIELKDNFMEDIGVDWRGLSGRTIPEVSGTTGSDDAGMLGSSGSGSDWRLRIANNPDRGVTSGNVGSGLGLAFSVLSDIQVKTILHMVYKESKGNVLVAPKLTCFDGQRANVLVAEQVTYIADYEVEVAENSVGASPVIERALDGISLDVRPIVSADRKYITIEVRPALARLKTPMRQQQIFLGFGIMAPIDLPEASLKSVETTVMIPDGGTVLLGGLMDRAELSHNVGVPFLSKIPIINFLFRKKAKGVERRNLIILLKAKILSIEDNFGASI